jgi:hypothetical protein
VSKGRHITPKKPGPKSAEAKAITSLNALRHGLSAKCILIQGEHEEAWHSHRSAVFAAIGPEGAVEEGLAERVAVQLWRLRRLVRFETATLSREEPIELLPPINPLSANRTAFTLEQHEEEMRMAEEALDAIQTFAEGDDDDLLSVSDLTHSWSLLLDALEADIEEHEHPAVVTLGALRGAVSELCDYYEETLEEAQERATEAAEEAVQTARDALAFAQRSAATAQAEKAVALDATLDRIVRYEAHLERSLMRTLAEIDRARAFRAGIDGAVPRALAVNFGRD